MTPTPMSSPLSRRLFLGSLAAVGATTALAACGGSSTPPGAGVPSGAFGQGDTYTGPKVALSFWNGFTGGDGPFMRQLVEQFNKANPTVTVSMNTLQWGDYYAKVPNAVASGAGPDIGIMHIDQLATNAARRVIIPLDEVASGLKLTESDFAPVVWKAGVYQDKRYGIPLDIHPLGFYANTGQLSKAGIDKLPTDRAGFEAAVKALQAGGGVKQPFWVTATWPAHLMFTALVAQFGGSIYDAEGGKATFNSDAGVESLEWLRSFITNGASPANVSNDAQAQAFRQQRNSLTWDGIWMMNEWAKVNGLKWGAAALPTIGDKPATWASSHNFVVTTQATKDKNKLAASRAFISYVSERSIEWAKSGQIPARNSVRESAAFSALPVQSTLAAQLPNVVFPPAVPGIGDVTTPTFEAAVNEVILGKAQAKAALDAAAKKADALLADNRAKYQA
ncbi:MAG TPA: extracellular solute-binding protein [Intrasporangium sp.]|uniref:ABC transporter substrate-binding protein n=1 Tax=Intrasporangium sp. TaxID=1925024 RepID=UPI002D77A1E7|nr:extracellular solute-binding protein [Intrasporangium sp.]HET7397088.1 extracellular solute-binding protein [Intrasporangium sp.]